MSDNEEHEQKPENTSDDLGENQDIDNEEVQKDEIPKTGKKKPAMNKDGTPRKTLTEEQQKARLEVLRKGREKANHKRQILKEEALKQSKPEYHPPATQNQPEPETVRVVKSKPKPKKKTIIIEESESDESEEEIIVKKVKKVKKPIEPLPMNPPPPRPPPRVETEAEKKQKLKQMKDDLVNRKVYKSLFD